MISNFITQLMLMFAVIATTDDKQVVTVYDNINEAAVNLREAREYACAGHWNQYHRYTDIKIVPVKQHANMIVEMKKIVDTR